ncbi:hypothetical protein Mapa_016528 [Marchantia paleacea]|nr:hypothetical protein Mapa_016528 [Marchantia paleacea]
MRASTFVGGEKSFAFKLRLNFSKLVPGNHESSRRIVGLLKINPQFQNRSIVGFNTFLDLVLEKLPLLSGLRSSEVF